MHQIPGCRLLRCFDNDSDRTLYQAKKKPFLIHIINILGLILNSSIAFFDTRKYSRVILESLFNAQLLSRDRLYTAYTSSYQRGRDPGQLNFRTDRVVQLRSLLGSGRARPVPSPLGTRTRRGGGTGPFSFAPPLLGATSIRSAGGVAGSVIGCGRECQPANRGRHILNFFS